MSASIWTPGSLQVPALPAVAPVLFVPGTVSAPGIAFVGDADTGFWQTGPGVIKAAVNGDNIFNILPEGVIFGGGKKLRLAPEVDLASAATCDIGAATSNYIRITGTTGITSFGTNHAGPMFIRFEGALTLTNSSTLIIPGGANLTTAAGDCAIVIPKATAGVSDGWQIVAYQRAIGTGSFTTLTTSGEVGIGGPATATYRLDVQRADSANVARFYQAGAGLATAVYWNNVSVVGNAYVSRLSTGEFVHFTSAAHPIDFYTNSVFRARINAAGNMGIGADAPAGNRLHVSSSATATGAAEFAGNFLYSAGANTSSFSQVACQGTITAAAGYVGTGVVGGVRGTAVVGAAGLTIPILSGVTGNVTTSANSTVTTGSAFRANFSNAGGSVFTTVAGYFSEDFSVAGTTVASFYSLMASGTNKYGVYIAGTAPNWFNGDVLIFGAGNLGYTTGAGGSVTQLTSRTTPIPAASLDKSTGSITMFSAAGSATAASFTVNNSKVGVNDTVNLSVRSATNKYIMMVTAVAAGSYEITFFTTGGTAVDAPVINFSVIKGSVT